MTSAFIKIQSRAETKDMFGQLDWTLWPKGRTNIQCFEHDLRTPILELEEEVEKNASNSQLITCEFNGKLKKRGVNSHKL